MEKVGFANIEEMLEKIDSGVKVYWKTNTYEIIQSKVFGNNKYNSYLIKCMQNNYCIGLFWADTTLSCKLEDCYYYE